MAPPAESKGTEGARTAAIPLVFNWIRRVTRGRRQGTRITSHGLHHGKGPNFGIPELEEKPEDPPLSIEVLAESSELSTDLEERPRDEPPSSKDITNDATWSLDLQHLPQLQTLPQSQSFFLGRLPLELREMIYREVISGSVIHLYKIQDGLRAYDCYRPDGLACKCGHVGAGPDSRIARRLALPLTCRQIHQEAIPILYSTNTYVTLINKDLAPALIHLPRLLHTDSFHAIKSLCVRWSTDGVSYATSEPEWPWRLVWETIASMKALRHLRFHVDMWHPEPSSWRGWFRQEKGLLRIAEQHAEEMALNSFTLSLPDSKGVAVLQGELAEGINIGGRVYSVERGCPSDRE